MFSDRIVGAREGRLEMAAYTRVIILGRGRKGEEVRRRGQVGKRVRMGLGRGR